MLLSLHMYCWSVPPTMLKPSPKVSQRESWWEKPQSFRHSRYCWGLYPPTLSCFLHHTKTHSTQIRIILSNSHCLERLFSWNWSWKQRRDPECLKAQVLHSIKHPQAVFRWVLGNIEARAIVLRCRFSPQQKYASSAQHERKGKHSAFHRRL